MTTERTVLVHAFRISLLAAGLFAAECGSLLARPSAVARAPEVSAA